MNNKVEVPLAKLTDLTDRCLRAIGHERSDIETIREMLLYAQARGSSQGLIKIVEGTLTPDPARGTIEIVSERGAVLRLDGKRNPGMVVCRRAVCEVMRLCEMHGLAFVGTHNTSTSTGAIGFYARDLARAGFIGIVLSGSGKVVAMEGGIDPVFGTNPIAVGVPAADEPLILDMATSAMALFSLIEARGRGESIADDIAFDAGGEPTTDPAEAMAGALRTFGGHKGAGLALIVEILTGPLAGGGIVGDGDAATNRGCAFIAINPSFLIDEETFKERVETLCSRVRAGRTRAGIGEILLPGDGSRRRAEAASARGTVAVDAGLYEKLAALAGL